MPEIVAPDGGTVTPIAVADTDILKVDSDASSSSSSSSSSSDTSSSEEAVDSASTESDEYLFETTTEEIRKSKAEIDKTIDDEKDEPLSSLVDRSKHETDIRKGLQNIKLALEHLTMTIREAVQ